MRYPNDIALTQTQFIYNDISERKATYKPDLESNPSRLSSPSREGLEMRVKTLLSTKKLEANQRELLLGSGLSFVAYDAIEIKPVDFTLSRKLENIIITSQNGAKAFLNRNNSLPLLEERARVRCFSVGPKTEALLTENGIKVTKTAQNASKLAHFIAKEHKNEQFTYFCGKQRRDELPTILKEASVSCNEVVVYETYLNEQAFDRAFDGILFFSPSGVKSYVNANHPSATLRVQENTNSERSQSVAFCIGETTASEAQKYFEQVVVSNATTIESTIAKAVHYLK